MKFMAREECPIAKELRHKLENAKNDAQRKLCRDLLDNHKKNCSACNGRK